MRLFLSTKDEFLKQKLEKKTKEFFRVAQSVDNKLAQKQIDDLNEFIEILIHLKASDLSPALLAQKNLLRLRSEITDFAPADVLNEEKEANHAEKPKKKSKNSKYKNLETEIRQILKDKPDGLSLREIIPCLLSRCSRRTLQRSLNKLASGGFLLKKGLHASARYFPA